MVLSAPPEQRPGTPGDRGSAPLPTVIVPADIRPPWRAVFGALLLGVLCTLLGAQGAYFAESAKTEVWQAVGEIEFRDANLFPETVAVTLESPSIWQPISQREGISDRDFKDWYSAEVAGGSQIVRVKFGDPDRERARRIVDGVMDAYFTRFRLPSEVDQRAAINDRLEELRIDESTLQDRLLDRSELPRELQIDLQNELLRNQGQQTTLSIALNDSFAESQRRIDTQARRLAETAYIEEDRLEPNPMTAAVFGAGVGGLVGVVAIYLALHRTAMPQTPAVDINDPSGTRAAARRRYRPVGGTVGRFAKRTIDVLASAALLILLAPFLFVIAVGVRLSSKGPAFFKQERVGQRGELFEILKFRTMTVNNDDSEHRAYIQSMLEGDSASEIAADAGGVVHKLRDNRVTGIGGFLRRVSLDELPQLWNVLRGDMSLIGPRPALAWEHELFSDDHQDRVRAVPGCSGLWQTSGRNMLTMSEMLDLDIQYIEQWSFRRDVGILLKTPFAILRGDGAR